MGRTFGNIGVLNLLEATEDSIKEVDSIKNVGTVLYRKENAHLLTKLAIGNIGATLEVPGDARFVTGVCTLDAAYLEAVDEPMTLLVTGIVVVDHDVTVEHIKRTACQLKMTGNLFVPPQLKGAIGLILKEGTGQVKVYEGAPPRLEVGVVMMTNGYLQGLQTNTHLIVNGQLTLAADLDLDLFHEKIWAIEVNGKVKVYSNQQAAFYQKGQVTGVATVIPEGFEPISSSLRINARSIRRFRQQSIYTESPIIFEAGISREAFEQAISSIHSTSFIVCHEDIEDLIYERLERLETDVLTFANQLRYVGKEEDWTASDLLGLEKGTEVIVDGILTLSEDIEESLLNERIGEMDILGEVIVQHATQKALIQRKGRLISGILTVASEVREEVQVENIGTLSL
ncbi:hypothetical protein E2L07_16035 [Halalkalibacterium halodurans]|uniref:hypothetical protein n=1 Tax=Halalkalibacterium halodurans TaxID=86665 RepID=UPI001067BE16|nr:hypothetical protein [Halalkalibacterium halodurans]TES51556.1 hypothetical protein E2L07_16035 [Halalkalibacterium halodurans]